MIKIFKNLVKYKKIKYLNFKDKFNNFTINCNLNIISLKIILDYNNLINLPYYLHSMDNKFKIEILIYIKLNILFKIRIILLKKTKLLKILNLLNFR